MFSDPEAAYLMSKEYSEENERNMQEQQLKLAEPAPTESPTPPDENDESSSQADG